MNRNWILTILLGAIFTAGQAQQKSDTVIVELAKTSRVIFTVKDRKDLDILKHYDFQQLFQDILVKLEKNDTSALAKDTTKTNDVAATTEDWNTDSSSDDDDDDDDDNDNWNGHNNRWGRTWQSFNFELGTNNYLQNGKFPDSNNELYSVRPWGSWYVGLSSIQRTRLGKKFFLEWGVGMNWYNFKFQQDNVVMVKDDAGVHFAEDTRDVHFIKSKLTASYITASLVPVIDFGDHSRKARIWEGYGNSFRIGLGPYIGYRVGSHSKLVYNDGGREKDKQRDSFYLNNVRYGARLQIGYRSTDLFFNYDMNELFSEGRGPALNAFSFGVIF
ncbi:hypothetical protein [Chryseolinea lacunae]|uniref:Outer membrane protein beta-barrel domain-containing protein n=1 Tax=Chryseolinea lacunae TaxID=2801331 RepID=A0ABS1KTN1_9BACT|nr:hypothetical protein [Chryseolinea lacunae]MBL0742800.1 hypothetical protein [Chryseolinea lacunae]